MVTSLGGSGSSIYVRGIEMDGWMQYTILKLSHSSKIRKDSSSTKCSIFKNNNHNTYGLTIKTII